MEHVPVACGHRFRQLVHSGFGTGIGTCRIAFGDEAVRNHKRVYRIYRALELKLRIKPRKRLVREKPEPLVEPTAANQLWSMD